LNSINSFLLPESHDVLIRPKVKL